VSDPVLKLFVSCAPGLESMLAAELRGLDIGTLHTETLGGENLRGDRRDMMRANLWVGLGLQVLVRVAEFSARHMAELELKSRQVEWKSWLLPGVPVRIKANSQKSRLYHTGGIAQRVRAAIEASLGPVRETGEEPPIVAQVRMRDDRCMISLESSGDSLHKRGWKLAVGRAPLREDLARALLVVSGWRPGLHLVDPMAGAGTILIEAASWARGMAPGANRTFAFSQTALREPQLLADLRADAAARVRPSQGVVGVGGDRDSGAIDGARTNADRAGVGADLRFNHAALGRLELPATDELAWVTNPPYGKRISSRRNVRDLYAALGKRISTIPASGVVGILCDDPRLAAATRLPLRSALMTDLGGLKVRAFVANLSSGEQRPP
jgi:putative N6-adenine-specific DNA methylase